MNILNLLALVGLFVMVLGSQATQARAVGPEETGQIPAETVRCTANPDLQKKILPQDPVDGAGAGQGVAEGA